MARGDGKVHMKPECCIDFWMATEGFHGIEGLLLIFIQKGKMKLMSITCTHGVC